MGDLTKNISRHELKCKCGKCKVSIQDHEPVIKMVQSICDHYELIYKVPRVKLIITSAARCYEYNRIPFALGGPGSTDESQHPRCGAIDFKIFVNDVQIPPREINELMDARWPDKYGMGQYKAFNHLDDRTIRARWRKR